jgi:ABC-type transport system involved in multi-copper enzyme maturation permease subunit
MNNIFALAILTFKEGVRHRMLQGIAVLSVVMAVLTILIPNVFMYDLGKVAIDIGLSTISLSGLLIIFFLAINILGRDLDKRTIYMVLATPTSRAQYIVGKFLGICFLLVISFIFLSLLLSSALYILTTLYPAHISARFSWNTLFATQFFLFLELILIAAIVFCIASFSSSFYLTLILSGLVYMIGTSLESVQLALSSKDSNMHLEGTGTFLSIIKWVFPNLAAFDFKTIAAYGLPLEPKILILTFFYWLFYTISLLLLTVFIFNKKELS